MDLKPIFQNKWLLALGVLGILCLIFGSFWNGSGRTLPTMASLTSNNLQMSSNPTTPSTSNSVGQDVGQAANVDATLALQQAYQKELIGILQKIAGIRQVDVMVTLNSTDTLTVANSIRKTTETNANGSQKSQSSTVDSQPYSQTVNGNSVPFVVESVAPTVRGVLVTVAAEDFYTAKAEIIDAITNALDVPAYKISVEPEKVNS